MAHQFDYDVAFSFLSQDEAAAMQINDRLQDRYRTFLYSQRQKELAGTDGEITSVKYLLFKRVPSLSCTGRNGDQPRGRELKKRQFATVHMMRDMTLRPSSL